MVKIGKLVIIVSGLLSIIFIGYSLYFTFQYLFREQNEMNYELSLGVAYSFIYGFFPALLSMLATYFIRNDLTKISKSISYSLLPLLLLSVGLHQIIVKLAA